MSRIRWGIISTAKIGVQKVIPAMQRGEHCHITAIASRNLDQARSVAEKLGIPAAYGSYEELLADPNIDAIYNPLPNHLHVPWSIKALEAGKHVLCEKPIGLTSAEGQQLVDAARRHPRLKVMEAFMYRHHPQWLKAQELVDNGSIGELKTIQSFFSYNHLNAGNYRLQPEFGGGGLFDIGCYSISLSRFLFKAEPTRVCGIVEFDPQFKVDRLASAILDFGSGTSSFTCSMSVAPYQRVNIFGTTGRVEIEIPFNAPPDRPCKLWHQQGSEITEILIDVCDQYHIQGELFSLAILNNTPVPTPIEDAVQNMVVIENIFAAAKQGTWLGS